MTWVPVQGRQVSYLAVARTERAAREKTAVHGGHPVEELYAVEVHRDEGSSSPPRRGPSPDKCLGRLDQFLPQKKFPCRDCGGRGVEKRLISAGDWEMVECRSCRGTGVRRRVRPA